ncbi:hypothetical protein [Aeoliella mucimassa]|uniref:Uncharacterized protein n=1 Tax=Aeoliella mucimassa TaxID=2527972 RepID=A0A518AQS1_9BACT|nr:hypothetical protein [Aeoliella mucimassa]QDU57067.1 hypothetical protein Pan181_32810 [Aeoliella mucimassa]
MSDRLPNPYQSPEAASSDAAESDESRRPARLWLIYLNPLGLILTAGWGFSVLWLLGQYQTMSWIPLLPTIAWYAFGWVAACYQLIWAVALLFDRPKEPWPHHLLSVLLACGCYVAMLVLGLVALTPVG